MSFPNAQPHNYVTAGIIDANSRRRSSSSSIFLGFRYRMKGRYLPMTFVLINLLGLLRYRGIMIRTLQQITIQNESSSEREGENASIPTQLLISRRLSSLTTNTSDSNHYLQTQNLELDQQQNNDDLNETTVGRAPAFEKRTWYMRHTAKLGWKALNKGEEVDLRQGPDILSIPKEDDGLNINSTSLINGTTDTQSKRIVTMSTTPDSVTTNDQRQAEALVTLLKHFQPRTALKPHLKHLKMIENGIESSVELASSSLRGAKILLKKSAEKLKLDSSSTIDEEPAVTRKWAYTFLLGGARSRNKGTEYLGGLYSVVAATYHLRKLGSSADFVLMVQIAAESSHHKLPESEEEILQKMDIKVVYIPKFANAEMECFYSLMMEKFRLLNMTKYSRVMYLDYDVMPTCNLDYLFDLSDPLPRLPSSNISDTTNNTFRLKENIILAYQSEPSSGGLFVLKPNATDFDRIQRIIYEKEVKSLELPYPHWDPIVGWGHEITKPDYWKDVRGHVKSNWTWYGVEADQGLLYFWTKYVKKSVSIVTRYDVEQWGDDDWENTGANGPLVLRQSQKQDKDGMSTFTPTIEKNAFKNYGCPKTHHLPSPYNDFFHMTGRAKPWFQNISQLEDPDCTDRHKRECDIQVKWYQLFNEALVSIKMIDRVSWDVFGSRRSAPVGHAPSFEQIAMYMYAKKERNWNQYEDDNEDLI